MILADLDPVAAIAIDADADTPVLRWNGSTADIQWLKEYMDYMPYEISMTPKKNNRLLLSVAEAERIS